MPAFAIDLGGSHIRAGIVSEKGIVAQRTISTTADSFTNVLVSLEKLAKEIFAEANMAGTDCQAVAFGFPGAVDSVNARVLATNAKFEGALDFDFQRWARDSFGCRIVLENDARMALIGEHHAGAAMNLDDVAMMVLGTGIGTAVLLAGRPLRGSRNQAGSLGGHIPIRIRGRICNCGGIGCAEAEASTWALPAICRNWAGFEESRLALAHRIDFRALFTARDQGDRVAIEVFDHCVEVWAALAIALSHAYSPRAIIVGGGVIAGGKEEIVRGLSARLNRSVWDRGASVIVKASSLGATAALYAAIPLLREAGGL